MYIIAISYWPNLVILTQHHKWGRWREGRPWTLCSRTGHVEGLRLKSPWGGKHSWVPTSTWAGTLVNRVSEGLRRSILVPGLVWDSGQSLAKRIKKMTNFHLEMRGKHYRVFLQWLFVWSFSSIWSLNDGMGAISVGEDIRTHWTSVPLLLGIKWYFPREREVRTFGTDHLGRRVRPC